MEKTEKHEIVPYKTYIMVWLALLVLTALTVWVAGFELGAFAMVVALGIASVKAGLVANIFMHLKFDAIHYKIMFGVSIMTLIFMFIVFFDIAYR